MYGILQQLILQTISYSATSYVIHVISSTNNYSRQSPQLQKTIPSDHAD